MVGVRPRTPIKEFGFWEQNVRLKSANSKKSHLKFRKTILQKNPAKNYHEKKRSFWQPDLATGWTGVQQRQCPFAKWIHSCCGCRVVHGDMLAMWRWGLRVTPLLPTGYWFWATRKISPSSWWWGYVSAKVVKIHLVGR